MRNIIKFSVLAAAYFMVANCSKGRSGNTKSESAAEAGSAALSTPAPEPEPAPTLTQAMVTPKDVCATKAGTWEETPAPGVCKLQLKIVEGEQACTDNKRWDAKTATCYETLVMADPKVLCESAGRTWDAATLVCLANLASKEATDACAAKGASWTFKDGGCVESVTIAKGIDADKAMCALGGGTWGTGGCLIPSIFKRRWTQPALLGDEPGNGEPHYQISYPYVTPVMEVDSKGVVHLIWRRKHPSSNKGEVWHARYENHAWSTPLRLTEDSDDVTDFKARWNGDTGAVAWLSMRTINGNNTALGFNRIFSAGSWKPTSPAFDLGYSPYYNKLCSAAVSPQGTAMTVWGWVDGSTQPAGATVGMTYSFFNKTDWQHGRITAFDGKPSFRDCDIAMSPTGETFMAWAPSLTSDTNGTLTSGPIAAISFNGETWGSPIPLGADLDTNGNPVVGVVYPTNVRVKFLLDGKLMVAFVNIPQTPDSNGNSEYSGNRFLWTTQRTDGQWAVPNRIDGAGSTNRIYNPEFFAGPTDALVWTQTSRPGIESSSFASGAWTAHGLPLVDNDGGERMRPKATTDTRGNWLVAWSKGGGSFTRDQFSVIARASDESTIGQEATVRSYDFMIHTYNYRDPQVAFLSNGDAILVWVRENVTDRQRVFEYSILKEP